MAVSRLVFVAAALALASGDKFAHARANPQNSGRPGYIQFNGTFPTVRAPFQTESQSRAALTSQAVAPPTITAGKILTPTINVARQRAYPEIEFEISAPGQVSGVSFDIMSPSGLIYYATFLSPPGRSKGALRAALFSAAYTSPGGAMLNRYLLNGSTSYLEPGAYTLYAAEIGDYAGHTTEYNASQLATVFGGGQINVTNSGKADVTPPTVVSASIITSNVSLSSTLPYVGIKFSLTDDFSGVSYIIVNSETVDSKGVAHALTSSGFVSVPFTSGNLTAFTIPLSAKMATGTYTVELVQLCDVAGNCFQDSNASDISEYFGGNVTFEVTQ